MAIGVEWGFTKYIYAGYVPDYGDIYTGVVQDLVDGKDRHDQVEGYTLQQIEHAIMGAQTFNQWRDNLKNLYDNDTQDQVNALFAYWD